MVKRKRMDTVKVSIPFLNNTNYSTWSKRMMYLLMSKGLTWTIKEDGEPSSGSTYEERQDEARDIALGLIGQHVSNELFFCFQALQRQPTSGTEDRTKNQRDDRAKVQIKWHQ